jgi:hypothetical protein
MNWSARGVLESGKVVYYICHMRVTMHYYIH